MDGTERTLALTKARAPSPRFIGKDWNQLPRELQDVLTKTGFTYEDGVTRDAETEDHDRMGNFQDKSDVEQGVYGGIPTNTPFDADEDYEEEAGDKKEQFGLEEEAPVTKDDDGVTTDGVNAVYSDVAEGKRRQKGVPEQVGETYGLQYGVKGLCNKKDNT